MDPPDPPSGTNLVRLWLGAKKEFDSTVKYYCERDMRLDKDFSSNMYEITCVESNDGHYDGVNSFPTCVQSKYRSIAWIQSFHCTVMWFPSAKYCPAPGDPPPGSGIVIRPGLAYKGKLKVYRQKNCFTLIKILL